jgi:hypothetical protein
MMRIGRIGGWLVLVASGMLVLVAILGALGASIGVVDLTPGGLLAGATMLALGAGFVALGLGGAPDIRVAAVRALLIATGVGLVVLPLSARATMDSPWIIALLAGGALAWLGGIVLLVTLAVAGGPGRVVAGLVVLGTIGAAVGGALSVDDDGIPGGDLAVVGSIVTAAGALLVIAGLVVLGRLGLRAGRPEPASAPDPSAITSSPT